MNEITVPTHTFALPSGEVVTVDAADRELVEAAGPWFSLRQSHTTYVLADCRKPDGSPTKVLLHRLLLDPPAGMDVDHVNHNGLDNVRANLRVCTRSQNMANSPSHRGGSSRFKGVCWHKRQSKWQARCSVDGREVYLGYFTAETDAARAYDHFAAVQWPGFCWLNRDHFDLTEVS